MNKIFSHRIPTILAIILLVVAIGISVVLLGKGVFYVGKAAPDPKPQNVMITNISDSSFTVVFVTTQQAESVVSFSQASSNTIILDDRDKSTGTPQQYYSHHITVPNLLPNKNYNFTILSGGREYSPFKATTGGVITSSPPSQNPLFGAVLLADGNIGNDVVLTFKTVGGQLSSSVTDTKGTFVLPTNSLRTEALLDYVILSDTSQFEIDAFRADLKSKVTASFLAAQSLPTITLQQAYNFVQTPQEKTASVSSELTIPVLDSVQRTISVTTPQDNQNFIDDRPLFKGRAFPNAKVEIDIKNFLTTTIVADNGGNWSYRSDNRLSATEHELAIETADNLGKKTRITRKFSIFSSGSQVNQSATPSASPTIRPTIPPTATPTQTTTPTPTPTVTPTTELTITPTTPVDGSPTPTGSISTPSATLAPTTTIAPSGVPGTATPTQTPTGNMRSTIFLSVISFVFIAVGTILLFAL